MKKEVLILKKIEGNYFLDKKIVSKKDIITIGSKKIILDDKSPIYIKTGILNPTKAVYLIDINGKQIGTKEIEQINPELLDMLINKNIFNSLTSITKKSMKEIIFYLILGGIIGLLIGIICGGMI